MNIICTIEGCGHLSENRDIGLCATHAREARKKSAPKAKPARKRIPKQSDEGKERMAVYRAIKSLWLERHTNTFCDVCAVEFTSEPHHKRGKLGDLLYDVRYWLPVCRKCHTYIETHPEEAYEQGWSLSRHQTETI